MQFHEIGLTVLLTTSVLMITSCAGGGEKKGKETADAATDADADADAATERNPALLDPALANDQAPESFKAMFSTTKGDFVIEVPREWAPEGADRFYNLVKIGYFDGAAFFRNIDGFMVQFGINGNPAVNKKWHRANFNDDPVKQSNQRGYVTFAQTSARHSRSTQIFINFGDNGQLDDMRFAPFGRVAEGMKVVDSLYNGYGEGAPGGRGPDQSRVQSEGNAYLKQDFPKLDYIKTAKIVE
ncbi:MAG TPA: peptidylprolyl isomerase [Pirellulales bacterium]